MTSIKIASKKQVENDLTAKNGIGLCVWIVRGMCQKKKAINFVERIPPMALIASMCGLQGENSCCRPSVHLPLVV